MLRDLRRSYVSLSTCSMECSQYATLLQMAQLLIGMHSIHSYKIMAGEARMEG